MESLKPQQILAAGFGEATMNTLKRLSGFISAQQIRLVTLSGGVGPYMTGIGQLNAACPVSIIPAPLRASSAEIAQTLKMKIASMMSCWPPRLQMRPLSVSAPSTRKMRPPLFAQAISRRVNN